MWKIRLDEQNGINVNRKFDPPFSAQLGYGWHKFVEMERQELTADEFTNGLVKYIENVLMSNVHLEHPYNTKGQLTQLRRANSILDKFQNVLRTEAEQK